MPLKVEIQYCKNCHLHNWCSRHDEIKYIDFFEQLSYRIESQFPTVQIKQRQIPEQLELIRENPFQEKKYLNKNTGEIAMFPRSGAFEVYVEGYRIFSKIKTKRWPKFDRIVETIKKMITAHNNDEDLVIFDVEYEAPNKKVIPITNSDLYDIKTIFRVRKSVNESPRQSRTLDHHEILPDRDIAGYIASTNPEKNRYKNVRNLIPGLHGQTLNLDDKANVYLQQIYPRKTSRDPKKKRILLMKDEEHGSIILQNQKGERQTYFKNLEKKSRQNSRNRRKLKPLTNTKPPIRNTRKFEDQIQMSEYSDALEDHEKGLRENQMKMRGVYGYRQSKLLKKKSDRVSQQKGKSQTQSLLNNQEISEQQGKDDQDNVHSNNQQDIQQIEQNKQRSKMEQPSNTIDKNNEHPQSDKQEDDPNQFQNIQQDKQIHENQGQKQKQGQEQKQVNQQPMQTIKMGEQNDQEGDSQQKEQQSNNGDEDQENNGDKVNVINTNNQPQIIDVTDDKGDNKGDTEGVKGDKWGDEVDKGDDNIGEQQKEDHKDNQQSDIQQKNQKMNAENNEDLLTIKKSERNWGQFDCYWKAKSYGGQFHLIADDQKEETQQKQQNIRQQDHQQQDQQQDHQQQDQQQDHQQIGEKKENNEKKDESENGNKEEDLIKAKEDVQSQVNVQDGGQEKNQQKVRNNRNDDDSQLQVNKAANQELKSQKQPEKSQERSSQKQLQKQHKQPSEQPQNQYQQHNPSTEQLQSFKNKTNNDQQQRQNQQKDDKKDEQNEQNTLDQIVNRCDHQWNGVYQDDKYQLVGV